jgi:hypothetical protein
MRLSVNWMCFSEEGFSLGGACIPSWLGTSGEGEIVVIQYGGGKGATCISHIVSTVRRACEPYTLVKWYLYTDILPLRSKTSRYYPIRSPELENTRSNVFVHADVEVYVRMLAAVFGSYKHKSVTVDFDCMGFGCLFH